MMGAGTAATMFITPVRNLPPFKRQVAFDIYPVEFCAE
jgi:hypothetical protein